MLWQSDSAVLYKECTLIPKWLKKKNKLVLLPLLQKAEKSRNCQCCRQTGNEKPLVSNVTRCQLHYHPWVYLQSDILHGIRRVSSQLIKSTATLIILAVWTSKPENVSLHMTLYKDKKRAQSTYSTHATFWNLNKRLYELDILSCELIHQGLITNLHYLFFSLCYNIKALGMCE